jgi:hypothetical protein
MKPRRNEEVQAHIRLSSHRKKNLREQGCEDPWLFFEAKRGLRAKKKSLGNTGLRHHTPSRSGAYSQKQFYLY